MENIPTALDFINNSNDKFANSDGIYEAMVEFAKLHVQAALKEAALKYRENTNNIDSLTNSIILNAYPLDKII